MYIKIGNESLDSAVNPQIYGENGRLIIGGSRKAFSL